MICWPCVLSMRGKVMSSLPCLALLDFFVTTVVVGCKGKKKNIMTLSYWTSHVLLLALWMQTTSFNWIIIILCPGVQLLRHLNTLFFVLFLLTSSFFKHTSLKSGKNPYFSLSSILALRFARNHSNRYLEVALGPACFVQRVSQVFVGPYCLEHVSSRLGLPCWLADNT